jgi:hypothetical protein
MKVTITIDTDNAAFDGDWGRSTEVARILRDLAGTVETRGTVNVPAAILDVNGNRCGTYRIR